MKIIRTILFLTLTFLIFSCTKDDKNNDTSVTGNGGTPAPVSRTLIFNFSPTPGKLASGNGKVYYQDLTGVSTYVFGTSTTAKIWSGTNTAQPTYFGVEIPFGDKVFFNFTAQTTSGYGVPDFSVTYVNGNGATVVILPVSHNLSGSFTAPN